MNYRMHAMTVALIAGLAVLPAFAQKRTAQKQTAAKKEAAQTSTGAETKARSGERRDPFVAVIRPPKPEAGPAALTCGAGVRSIIVGQIQLNGVVKSPSGMIAVVSTSPDRTFFLKENTPLCNGRVSKIGGDSVAFEENVIDAYGNPAKREVIRKIPIEAK